MSDGDAEQRARDWWQTAIVEMSPGVIRFRGYPIEQLIGQVSFTQMIWLLTRGELPSRAHADLLEAALMAGVDHGPQAPSIAIARMAATCGVGLNNALASGVNVLGDVHGGAAEQAVVLFEDIAARIDIPSPAARGAEAGFREAPLRAAGATRAHERAALDREGAASAQSTLEAAVRTTLDTFTTTHGPFIPGYGHRFHPVDPRAEPLLALVDAAAKRGEVSGRFAQIARAIETELTTRKNGRRIPLNIDGATAVIYAELGFPAPLARGLFCLSRSVGILAHAWEQMQQGGRNKGPIPREWTPSYVGEAKRDVPRK